MKIFSIPFAAAYMLASALLWMPPQPALGNYLENPKVQVFVGEMVTEYDFERDALRAIFSEARKQQNIIDLISRPAEKVMQWGDYRKIFLKPVFYERGTSFWNHHRRSLHRAEEVFEVPAEIIIAIIGVESRYGRYKGRHRVVDALSTLAFDYPPRSTFFRKQLREFLLLVREYDFDPLELRGSYAGAMGYGQFIPSSYRNYAVDFDGDGVADILTSPIDAIGSVANYLARHGWRKDGKILLPAQTLENFVAERVNQSLRPAYSLAELRRQGFVPLQKTTDAEEKAAVLGFQTGENTDYWLGMHNFHVLTRYNISRLYAMAVYQLAEELRTRFDNMDAPL